MYGKGDGGGIPGGRGLCYCQPSSIIVPCLVLVTALPICYCLLGTLHLSHALCLLLYSCRRWPWRTSRVLRSRWPSPLTSCAPTRPSEFKWGSSGWRPCARWVGPGTQRASSESELLIKGVRGVKGFLTRECNQFLIMNNNSYLNE